MAMFNSNLTSSISGWFTNAFQPKEDGEEEQPARKDGEPREPTNEKTEAQNEENSETKTQEQEDFKGKEVKEINENESVGGTVKEGAAQTGDEPESESNVDKASDDQDSAKGLVLDMKAEDMQRKLTEETQKMMQSAKSFGTYLFGVASEASKKVSSTVNETATTLKKTVEEKTILGDLNREQKDFIQKKREKQGEGAVPPWFGYQEEEVMKKQILALSSDTRNFLRSPPAGVQFQFEFQQMFPVALATLKEDENLNKMRFRLVPTKIKEEPFWRNYFYRVSLIKQSAQLSTLTEMQKSTPADLAASSESSASSIVMVGSTATGTMSRSSSSKSLTKPDAESSLSKSQQDLNAESPDLTEPSDDLPAEFASDAYDPSMLNPDDLEREMKELGMDNEGAEGIPQWEHELQKELQDYEVVREDKGEEMWEQELENMLTD